MSSGLAVKGDGCARLVASRYRSRSVPNHHDLQPGTSYESPRAWPCGATDAGSTSQGDITLRIEETVRRVLTETLSDTSMTLPMQTILNTYDEFTRNLVAHEQRILDTVKHGMRKARYKAESSASSTESEPSSPLSLLKQTLGKGVGVQLAHATRRINSEPDMWFLTDRALRTSTKRETKFSKVFPNQVKPHDRVNTTRSYALSSVTKKYSRSQKIHERVNTTHSFASSKGTETSSPNSQSHQSQSTSDSANGSQRSQENQTEEFLQAERILTWPSFAHPRRDSDTALTKLARKRSRKRRQMPRVIPGLGVLEEQVACQLFSSEGLKSFQTSDVPSLHEQALQRCHSLSVQHTEGQGITPVEHDAYLVGERDEEVSKLERGENTLEISTLQDGSSRSAIRKDTTLSNLVRKYLSLAQRFLMTHEQEVESLRQQRVAELTNIVSGSVTVESGEFSSDDEIRSAESCYSGSDMVAPWCLRMCGIRPWAQEYDRAIRQQKFCRGLGTWYNTLVIMLTLLGLCFSVADLISTRSAQSRTMSCDGHSCHPGSGRLADSALAVGSMLSFMSFRFLRQSRVLGAGNSLLVSCARRQGFLERWSALSQWDFAATCLLWIVVVSERVRGTVAWCQVVERDISALTVAFLVSFGLVSGILMASAYLILLIARAMSLMIDSFSFHFIQQPDFAEAVRDWNVLQAVLRKACGSVERCFLILLTSVLVAILLGFVEFMLSISDGAQTLVSLSPLLPGALIALVVVRIVFRAAAVSEKCARVPALINSLSFDIDIDQDRRYVVDYINNSAAGFYVYEVRLTSAMAFKFAYISGLVMFGVATKIASDM